MKPLFKIEIETENFNRHVAKFLRNVNAPAGLVIRKLALDLVTRIILKNPVDTGRSRAAWFVSFEGLGGRGLSLTNAKFVTKLGSKKKTTRKLSGDATTQGKAEGYFIDKLKESNPSVEIINAVKYIIPLEYGHSKQAPAGMVRLSMREMMGKAPNISKKGFVEEWNRTR